MKLYNRKERSTRFFRYQALTGAIITIGLLLEVFSRPYDWLSKIYTVGIVCGVFNLMCDWPRMFKDYRGSKNY